LADSKDLRWIDEFGDDLTMTIAMRDWDESLKLVEKGKLAFMLYEGKLTIQAKTS
jgi:hypothetical protein